MIVGNGLIAKVFSSKFKDRNDVIVFASGVSNSKEEKPSEFEREFNLLQKYINTEKLFIYFSTTSVNDALLKDNAYVKHKLEVEKLIKESCKLYLIIRASNLIGPFGNKNNVINYFFDKIQKREEFILWSNAKRNLLDVEDFYTIIESIIEKGPFNEIFEVSNFKNISVVEIVKEIELFLNIKSKYDELKVGGEVVVNHTKLKPFVAKELENKITAVDYLQKILEKYYA